MIRLARQDARPGSARSFRCTVHGLCFDNRYRLLETIRAGDPLVLLREPDNAIGADAIKVQNTDSETVGYVPRSISRWMAPMMDEGFAPVARVLKVRHGCPYYERLLMEVVMHKKNPRAGARGSSQDPPSKIRP